MMNRDGRTRNGLPNRKSLERNPFFRNPPQSTSQRHIKASSRKTDDHAGAGPLYRRGRRRGTRNHFFDDHKITWPRQQKPEQKEEWVQLSCQKATAMGSTMPELTKTILEKPSPKQRRSTAAPSGCFAAPYRTSGHGPGDANSQNYRPG